MVNHGLPGRVLRKTAHFAGDALIVTAVILLLPFYCVGRVCMKCRKEVKHYSRKGHRCYLASEAKQPIPLPFRRIHNLSNEDVRLVQQEGTLMKLPYDVRKRIWHYAVGNYDVEIVHEDCSQRLFCKSSAFQGDASLWYSRLSSACHCYYCYDKAPTLACKASKKRLLRQKPPDPNRNHYCEKPSFQLLTTCRQVYQECIPEIYGKTKFCMRALQTIPFFVQSVRHQHIARIRTLNMNFDYDDSKQRLDWQSACFCIATWMTSLEDLTLFITRNNQYMIQERDMLDCLREISGLKQFKLDVRYQQNVAATPEMMAYRKIIRMLCMRPRGEDWLSVYAILTFFASRRLLGWGNED